MLSHNASLCSSCVRHLRAAVPGLDQYATYVRFPVSMISNLYYRTNDSSHASTSNDET